MHVPRALTVCSTKGCPEITSGGRCPHCDREADKRRGTATERGYTGRGHRIGFRRAVLRRDPTCVCTDTSHNHPVPCGQPSTDADHHPLSKRELVARGLDPNDPRYGRGLCHSCHGSSTAQHQPGGWNAER